MRFRFFSLCALCALIAPAIARAQATDSTRATDSIYARARQLVAGGNEGAGRLLVDSMVAAAAPGSGAYAEALYWRAALAPTTAEAEPDYRRIVVEYPLSPRAADALLNLGEIEIARGDRAGARAHLERFLLENPTRPERGRAGFLLTRLLFDEDDNTRACAVLHRTLGDVPQDSVELRNQFEFYAPRCDGVDTTARAAPRRTGAVIAPRRLPDRASPPPAPPRPAAAHPDESRARVAAKPRATGRFTLQVAAYGARAGAEALVARLAKREIDARVVGDAKPFRVRIGRYATRTEAAREANALEKRGIKVFVTQTGADDR